MNENIDMNWNECGLTCMRMKNMNEYESVMIWTCIWVWQDENIKKWEMKWVNVKWQYDMWLWNAWKERRKWNVWKEMWYGTCDVKWMNMKNVIM